MFLWMLVILFVICALYVYCCLVVASMDDDRDEFMRKVMGDDDRKVETKR